MKLPIYQIDTFCTEVFSGNPAAVCPLNKWLDDSVLQSIAAENNLSETAFFVKNSNVYEMRWFTPVTEVDLCGHATLASAFVLMNEIDTTLSEVVFSTKSGELKVRCESDGFVMDFPSQPPSKCSVPDGLIKGLGLINKSGLIKESAPNLTEVLASEDYVVVYDSEEDIRNIAPDFEALRGIPLRGVAVTAHGNAVDFVSRFFGPKVGVDEDPVTGSSHCELAPYWAGRLGKNKLSALQLSKRMGKLYCELVGDRVLIKGKAVKYMQGEIYVEHID